jgi:hypothetical protein
MASTKKPSRYDYESPTLYAQAMRRWQAANAPKQPAKPKLTGTKPNRYDYDNPAKYAQDVARYRDGVPSGKPSAKPVVSGRRVTAAQFDAKYGNEMRNPSGGNEANPTPLKPAAKLKAPPAPILPPPPSYTASRTSRPAARKPVASKPAAKPAAKSPAYNAPGGTDKERGMAQWALANQKNKLAERYAKREATRGTSQTDNPLLKKDEGFMARAKSRESMSQQMAKSKEIVDSGKVAALKPATPKQDSLKIATGTSKNFRTDIALAPTKKDKKKGNA